MSVCMGVCMCVCMHACMCVCMCVCMYVYVCMCDFFLACNELRQRICCKPSDRQADKADRLYLLLPLWFSRRHTGHCRHCSLSPRTAQVGLLLCLVLCQYVQPVTIRSTALLACLRLRACVCLRVCVSAFSPQLLNTASRLGKSLALMWLPASSASSAMDTVSKSLQASSAQDLTKKRAARFDLSHPPPSLQQHAFCAKQTNRQNEQGKSCNKSWRCWGSLSSLISSIPLFSPSLIMDVC